MNVRFGFVATESSVSPRNRQIKAESWENCAESFGIWEAEYNGPDRLPDRSQNGSGAILSSPI